MADDHDDGWVSPRDRLKRLERFAGADPLTGLPNRRTSEQDLTGEISRAERQRTPLSCILLSVDQFTDVSGTTAGAGISHGRPADDHVLSEVAALLHRTLRSYDTLLQWRAGEFLIVLPGAGLEEAQLVAARVRHDVGRHKSSSAGSLLVSSAVATLTDYDLNEMLWRAERELDQAKRNGGTDPDPPVREPRKRGPHDRDSGATVSEP